MSSAVLKELETLEAQIKQITAEKIKLEFQLADLQTRRTVLKSQYNMLKNEEQLNWSAWSAEKYDWSDAIKEMLKHRFLLKKFREQQLAAINATLSNKDVIMLMPTGGGKSLCYQLPALVGNGMTLVISPLLSLMEDQIIKLKNLDINAMKMTSNEPVQRKRVGFDYMSKNVGVPIKLMYVTPEWLSKSKRFMAALQKCHEMGNLDRIAIDEVHCCSQWGHDFRPDYKYLGLLKGMFPNVPIIGLTATATSSVLLDIQDMLDITGCTIVKAPFDRPNLNFKVIPKPEKLDDCLSLLEDYLLNKYKDKSGIIYVSTIKDCEMISKGLRGCGVRVRHYHAELDMEERRATHQKWIENKYQAIVATIAFGMGIDKPDVRFVIHYSMPKSMEGLYQESGRAGRDGEDADCIVLFRMADYFKHSGLTKSRTEGMKLTSILEYCLTFDRCRHDLIGQHFEEKSKIKCGKMCDNCLLKDRVEKFDIRKAGTQIHNILDDAQKKQINCTLIKLIDLWFKAYKPTIRKEEAEYIVGLLILNDYLKEDKSFTAYTVNSYLVSKYNFTGSNAIMVKMIHSGGLKAYLKPIAQVAKSSLKRKLLAAGQPCSSKIIIIDE